MTVNMIKRESNYSHYSVLLDDIPDWFFDPSPGRELGRVELNPWPNGIEIQGPLIRWSR